MICALGLSLVAPSAMAGSITVRLYTSQEKACSDILGNTTGKYKVSEVVYDDSEYSVQEYLYVGETANHLHYTDNFLILHMVLQKVLQYIRPVCCKDLLYISHPLYVSYEGILLTPSAV